MPEDVAYIPKDEYKIIEKNVPIVSVDLLIHHKGGILLGKRKNPPACGEWFVPGGTVLKDETLREAAHRVAQEEVDSDIIIDSKLGTYEHFYSSSEFKDIKSKQYLATAFVVTPRQECVKPDEQHEELRVFKSPFPELHNYITRYIHDLQAQGYSY